MSRPKKAKRLPTAEERGAAQALGVSLEAPVGAAGRITRYYVMADDQPLAVVQATNRAAAEAVVARMRAPAHVVGCPEVKALPISKATMAMRLAWYQAVRYAWHPAACPSCLRVWCSPTWAIDTCPTCLGVAGVEGFDVEVL